MSTVVAAAPGRNSDLPSAVVVAPDAGAKRIATALLSEAGFPVRPDRREDAAASNGRAGDTLLVLLAGGTAADRVAAIAEHVADLPDAAVVVSMPDNAATSLLRRGLRAGANGIVLDHDVSRALVPTARAVAAGQLVVPLAMRRRLAPRALSYREREILSLVVLGYTNRQIARKLFLAESTVKTHLSSVFDKLDARSRAEAAAMALDPDADLALGLPAMRPSEATG